MNLAAIQLYHHHSRVLNSLTHTVGPILPHAISLKFMLYTYINLKIFRIGVVYWQLTSVYMYVCMYFLIGSTHEQLQDQISDPLIQDLISDIRFVDDLDQFRLLLRLILVTLTKMSPVCQSSGMYMVYKYKLLFFAKKR